MNDKKCGDCIHWHRVRPADVRKINLAAPQMGECRLEPPLLMAPLVANTQAGPQLQGMILAYRLLQADFPACSHHAARPDNGVEDGVKITLAKPNP